MSQVILDFGSGNTCANDPNILVRMFQELKKIDTGKHEVICKFQLFKEAPPNIPLSWDIFNLAYEYGKRLGYRVTASVFDKESLSFLLQYDVPFVKIANRRDLDWLIGEVPRKISVYVSKGINEIWLDEWGNIDTPENIKYLSCISKYPAEFEDYEDNFYNGFLRYAISDHTSDWKLFNTYQPEIYECHFKLPDSVGPDSGSFARTPEQLKEIL